TLPGARQEVHLFGLAQDAAGFRAGRDEHLAAAEPGDVEDFGPLGRTRVSAPRARARLDKSVQVEPKRVAVAPDPDGMPGRRIAFLLRHDHPGAPRIAAHRGDDTFAVLELELLLDRFAISGRRRDVDESTAVRDSEVGEEHARGARAARKGRQHRIALAQPCRRQILHFFLTLHPAVARHDDDIVLLDYEIVSGVFRLAGIARDGSPAFVALL